MPLRQKNHPTPTVGRKVIFRLLAIALVFCAGLIVAETIIRLFAFDWQLMRKLLYYQEMDAELFRPVDDPLVLFEPDPGTRTGDGRASINQLGYRGAEIPLQKPPETTRIVCLGGSNVYGAGLTDDETWPARLEQALNRSGAGSYKVLNGGVPSYVGVQMAHAARIALDRHEPDLIIMALSNFGSPAFLLEQEIAPLFRSHPEMWSLLFYADWRGSFAEYPKLKRALLSHVCLYRYAYGAAMARQGANWALNPQFMEINITAVREAVTEIQEKKVKSCFFLYPGLSRDDVEDYLAGMDAPVVDLPGDGLPTEYRDIHPPAHVMEWYAEQINRFFAEQGWFGVQAAPESEASAEELDPVKLESEMAALPGGTFWMGCSPGDDECFDDEKPRHEVTLSAFELDRTEVSKTQYRECVAADVCTIPAGADWQTPTLGERPVTGVSHAQAEIYCRWRGKRLPTEAEWEYAARAGGDEIIYGAPTEVAWFDENAQRRTHTIARKKPNRWGLYDMFGNVREWCVDRYGAEYYATSPAVDPPGHIDPTDSARVIRGGGWFTDRRHLRASYRRFHADPDFFSNDLGFRCAR